LNNSFLKGWADIGGFRYYFDQSSGAKKSRVGIDVSYYQGTIDWNKVKAAGVDFAIIRAGGRYYGGGGLYTDSYFVKNIKGALAAGIECGVYFFSAAINEVEGAQEANFILNAIQGYNITGPLVIDMECKDGRTQYLTRDLRTNIALTALEVLKNSGHKAMLYTGHNFYQNYLEPSRLTGYPLWIAFYTDDNNNVSDVPYSIWQYTSSGSVPGISGRVDLNIWK
jgi:GH25 family lysozyme M1 (1,4-beta-N-acetylmuramidase)